MKRTATGAMPVPDIDPSQGRLQISWSYADLHLAGTSTTVAMANGNADSAPRNTEGCCIRQVLRFSQWFCAGNSSTM